MGIGRSAYEKIRSGKQVGQIARVLQFDDECRFRYLIE